MVEIILLKYKDWNILKKKKLDSFEYSDIKEKISTKLKKKRFQTF